MKEKKSVLIASLAGIVACFLCIGMIFLYPTKDNNLKGNIKENNNVIPDNEEILLGDTETSCNGTYPYCERGVQNGSECLSNPNSIYTSDVDCESQGYYWYNGRCYQSETPATTRCVACNPGAYKGTDNKCYLCPAGSECDGESKYSCPAGMYSAGGATSCLSCSAGTYSAAGASECTQCSGNTYSAAGAGSCSNCGTNQTANSTHTACVNQERTCYKLANNVCTAVTVSGTTCDNSSGYYDTESACRGNLSTKCEDYDEVSDCPSYCYWYDDSCHTVTHSCTMNYSPSTNKITITGTSSKPGVNVTSSQINGNATSSYTPTSSGNYSGKVWFSDGGTATCSVSVTITPSPTPTTTPAPTITCPDVKVGSSVTCTVNNGSIQGGITINGTGIARVDYNHVGTTAFDIIGVNKGTTSGSASVNGTTVTFNINVISVEHPITGITINGPSVIELGSSGESRTFSATIVPSDADDKVVWSVDSTSIATIGRDTGILYAISAGTVTITAKAEGGSVVATKKVTINVRDDCTIEAINVNEWKRMSKDEEVEVKFVINGTNCGTQVTTTLHNFTGPATVQSLDVVKFKPSAQCYPGRISGCIKGTNKCSNTITIELEQPWSGPKPKLNQSSILTPNKSESNVGGHCVAYENCVLNSNNKYDCEQWNRCCGSSGGGSTPPEASYDFCCVKDDGSAYSWSSNQKSRSCPSGYHIDDTKDAITCTNRVPIPGCYKDSDNQYHWELDTNAPSSWVIVPGISKEALCKEETPACYLDTNRNYTWGNHATKDGYTLITSITDETLCNNPSSGSQACYKNDNNDYIWVETPPAGFVKIDGVTKPEDCHADEAPACYAHGAGFIWGIYKDVVGYIILDEITNEEECEMPKTEACYENPNGDYEWGDFSDKDDYKIIPSVTDINDCTNDVPTPKTDISVSKIMYIFMAILMLFGIGFIYYSTIMRRENQ